MELSNIYQGIDYLYFILFFVCASTIILYGRYRCLNIDKYKDPLQFCFNETCDLDGWSITHLLFYMFIGYLYPQTLILTMFFSGLWELFEYYVGHYKPPFMENWGFCLSDNCAECEKCKDGSNVTDLENTKDLEKCEKCKNGENIKEHVWWYGKYSDLLINFIGFIIGMSINRYMNT